MERITFGGIEHERLEVTIRGYERVESGEYYDDNWLSVEIAVSCGVFHGKFPAAFLTSELAALYDQLALLSKTLTGSTQFEALEGQLKLMFAGDGLGHIKILGEAYDQVGTGNKLIFALDIDQTQLQCSMRSLKTAISAYPART